MSYRITYDIVFHSDGIDREDVPRGCGACDAIGIVSVLHGEDGSSSHAFIGKNGRTGEEWTHEDWFKTWTLLASELAHSKTLGKGRQELCRRAFEVVRAAVLADQRGEPDGSNALDSAIKELY